MSAIARRVRGGTRGTKRLCDTCVHSHIMQGSAESEEEIYCTQISQMTPFRVVECNDYKDKSEPSLYDLREAAWILMTKKAGREVGFLKASEWRKEHKGEDICPEPNL